MIIAEEAWPALNECLLHAKFYTESFTWVHSHNSLVLESLFLWYRSSTSGKTSHTILKEKFPEKEATLLPFFSFFFCCVLLCEIRFARQGSVNACGAAVSVILCTGVASQGCWPGCQPSCWLSNHRSSFPRLGTQRKESGTCRHRAEHLRHVYFLQ